MRLFKRRHQEDRGGGTAVAERPPEAAVEFAGSTEELLAEIEALSEHNRVEPDRETERRLLRLRHLAGIRRLDAEADPQYPAPDVERLPDGPGLPEFTRDELTPGLLRAAILRDGCLLVRGLVDRADAIDFAQGIDRAFAERERREAGGAPAPGYYEEFVPHARFEEVTARPWIKEGGGVLAVDSPLLTWRMLELFRGAGVPRLVADYLGEPALISVHKTTLRKAEPTVPGAWHQDGAFMGDVRALNLWLSLSR